MKKSAIDEELDRRARASAVNPRGIDEDDKLKMERDLRSLKADLKSLTATPPTVTGNTAGNQALISLISALASLGFIIDETV